MNVILKQIELRERLSKKKISIDISKMFLNCDTLTTYPIEPPRLPTIYRLYYQPIF